MAKKSAQPKVADKSPKVFQREKISYELNIRERDDLTEKQIEILKAALDKDTRCVFIDGLYGSAKSYTAVLASLKLLDQKKVDQIIYVRNPIESSKSGKVGFLKGSFEEKIAPYSVILYDKLDELLPPNQVESLKADQRIDATSVGFVQGKNWACKAIIVDECANLHAEDFVMLLTRCAEFTRIFFIGDSVNQNYLGKDQSGFRKMFDKFNDAESKENGIHCFELRDESDIVRSKWLRFVLKKLEIIK